MKIPVLVDGGEWLVESDHIAQYIARKFDPADTYRVLSNDIAALNIRAVLNGLMGEEVKVILAKRMGVPIEQYQFFDDATEAIVNSLQWLEQNAASFNSEKPGYPEFHLVCAFEHIDHYQLLPLEYPRLRSLVQQVLANETILKTSPFKLKPKA